jgi:predicted GNAT superfamily acetyltransferase
MDGHYSFTNAFINIGPPRDAVSQFVTDNVRLQNKGELSGMLKEHIALTSITDTDEAAILELNNAHEIELSRLDGTRLKHLLAAAYHARMAPQGVAFLIAFVPDADYDGVHFSWFRERFADFVYVDRVVVAREARGRGIARALYADLFERAASDGHSLICCEVNVDPPNPASDAFHASLGFHEIGSTAMSNGKVVRYFQKPLPRK